MKLRFSAAFLWLAVSAVAQERQPDPAAAQPQPDPSKVVAEESPAQAETGLASEYRGPTILSRGGAPSIGRGRELLRLRPFVRLSGIYESGLGTLSTDSLGRLQVGDAYGVQAGFGVLGHRSWRHTALGVEYNGSLRHYSNRSAQDGLDNVLMLSLDHQLSPRVYVAVQQTAARYQHVLFMPIDRLQSSDPLLANVAASDLFDTPTYLLGSGARLVYQRTARLSFSAGGSGFLARHRSRALIGATGATATGDIAYRLSRFQTIAVQYDYTEVQFQHQFGLSYAHGAALNYSVRPGRNWEVSLRGGGYRLEMSSERRVQLDPIVAGILGVSSGVEAYHLVTYLPRYDVQITRTFRHASLGVNYGRSITPGNGLYLTSGSEMATVAFSYSGVHRLSLNTAFGTTKQRSLAEGFSGPVGNLRSYYGSASAGYRLANSLSLTVGVGGRQLSAGQNYDRTSYSAQVGLAWSPGDYPIALW